MEMPMGGMPMEMPMGVPMGMPTEMPMGMPMEMPMGVPTDIPMGVPMGMPMDMMQMPPSYEQPLDMQFGGVPWAYRINSLLGQATDKNIEALGLKPLTVGQLVCSQASSGQWWDAEVFHDNQDYTYFLLVKDDVQTQWPRVHWSDIIAQSCAEFYQSEIDKEDPAQQQEQQLQQDYQQQEYQQQQDYQQQQQQQQQQQDYAGGAGEGVQQIQEVPIGGEEIAGTAAADAPAEGGRWPQKKGKKK